MVPSASTTTTTDRLASTTTMKVVDDEEKKNTVPRALQWIMSSSSSSTLTIEEANRRSGTRRGGLWLFAVCIPPIYILCACKLAMEFHENDGIVFPRSAALAIVACGVYMALVMELFFLMSLLLPRAPDALRDAVVDVGVGYVGMPLACAVFLAACAGGGHAWMGVVVVACVYAALFAGIVAFWVWLVRTYA